MCSVRVCKYSNTMCRVYSYLRMRMSNEFNKLILKLSLRMRMSLFENEISYVRMSLLAVAEGWG